MMGATSDELLCDRGRAEGRENSEDEGNITERPDVESHSTYRLEINFQSCEPISVEGTTQIRVDAIDVSS